MNSNTVTITCSHKSAPETIQVCRHLLHYLDSAIDSQAVKVDWQRYYRRFTGNGCDYQLFCGQCFKEQEENDSIADVESNLVSICCDCSAIIEKEAEWDGVIGTPQIRERATNLDFRHESLILEGLSSAQLINIVPIISSDNPGWLAISQTSEIVSLDPESQHTHSIYQIAESMLDFSKPISLYLARNGEVAAVVNTRGQHGIVIDLQNSQVTMNLIRDDYHPEVSNFPIAFFEHQGRLLLVHGTEWNRLEISDPLSGELITRRAPTNYLEGETRSEHYLNYFHCGLTISPDQRWIVDNGWIWHPYGVLEAWDLQRWLIHNVWESEDGTSRKTLCWREWFWDGPLCWLENKIIAVYGYGKYEWELIPAVCIYDLETGEELRWFPGPHGELAFDEHLFSFSKEQGTAIWDKETGERLLHAPDFCPTSYHPTAKCFLTLQSDGSFILSHLTENTTNGQ